MLDLSKSYRFKALECEKLGSDASNIDIKRAWADVAIEWRE
jgi:hypothetical protein